jgi:hypothetical protein
MPASYKSLDKNPISGELEAHQIQVNILPSKYTSEGKLQVLKELDVTGKIVLMGECVLSLKYVDVRYVELTNKRNCQKTFFSKSKRARRELNPRPPD